jgi:hypothetical protein
MTKRIDQFTTPLLYVFTVTIWKDNAVVIHGPL